MDSIEMNCDESGVGVRAREDGWRWLGQEKMGENVIKMGEKNAKVDEKKTCCAIGRQKLKLGIA